MNQFKKNFLLGIVCINMSFTCPMVATEDDFETVRDRGFFSFIETFGAEKAEELNLEDPIEKQMREEEDRRRAKEREELKAAGVVRKRVEEKERKRAEKEAFRRQVEEEAEIKRIEEENRRLQIERKVKEREECYMSMINKYHLPYGIIEKLRGLKTSEAELLGHSAYEMMENVSKSLDAALEKSSIPGVPYINLPGWPLRSTVIGPIYQALTEEFNRFKTLTGTNHPRYEELRKIR